MEDSQASVKRFGRRVNFVAAVWLCAFAAMGPNASAQELRDGTGLPAPTSRTAAEPDKTATNQGVSISDDSKLHDTLPTNVGQSDVSSEGVEFGQPERPLTISRPKGRESARGFARGLGKPSAAEFPVGANDRQATPWYRTGLGALAVVLGLIGGLYFAARRWLPAARVRSDDGLMRVVGRTALSPRQSLALVCVGRRFVVVGVSPDRVDAVCEITDAEEVGELVARSGGQGGDAAFANWLNREAAGFVRNEGEAGRAGSAVEVGPRAGSTPLKELLQRLRSMQTK